MRLQSRISLENNQRRIGGVEKVIIDDVQDGFLICRSQRESPEVDGSILVDLKSCKGVDPRRLIGKFAAVRIVSATEYDLAGVLAGGYGKENK